MKSFTKALIAIPALLFTTLLAAAPSQAVGLTYASKVEAYQRGQGLSANSFRAKTENALGNHWQNWQGTGNDPTLVNNQLVKDNSDTAANFNPTNNFYHFMTLGKGGQAIFSFGTDFYADVNLWEVTWGANQTQTGHDERVKVYVGNTASYNATDWVELGEVWNIRDGANKKAEGANIRQANNWSTYRYVKLVDLSGSSSGDGFDVNAIAVRAVPEPATMSGVVAAAAGVVAMRRRRKAQQKEA